MTSTPNFERVQVKGRSLWKLSVVVILLILTFYLWECGSAILTGRRLADRTVQRFHAELNASEYEKISSEGDADITAQRDEMAHMLAAIHNKLGDALAGRYIGMSVNVGSEGTFVTAESPPK